MIKLIQDKHVEWNRKKGEIKYSTRNKVHERCSDLFCKLQMRKKKYEQYADLFCKLQMHKKKYERYADLFYKL